MLRAVSVHNVALIERAEIAFGDGVCAFTGETGAGKSVLLSALAFVVGGRSGKGLLRHGAEKGGVTASFDAVSPQVRALAEARGVGIEEGGELILRRVLDASGRGRAFINDVPVGAALLKEIGEALVEIHGQHDQRGLLDTAKHQALLDRYGGLASEAKEVGRLYAAWREAEKAYRQYLDERDFLARERDFVAHAVKELERLSPSEGLEQALDAKRERLKNAGRLLALKAEAEGALYGDGEGAEGLSAAMRRVQDCMDSLARLLPEYAAKRDAMQEKYLDMEALAEDALKGLSADEDGDEPLEAVEDRLYALRHAARKYNVTTDALSGYLEEMRRKLVGAEDAGAHAAALERQASEGRRAYAVAAEALHRGREEAAKALGKALTRELGLLHMPHAQAFVAVRKKDIESAGKSGVSETEFMLRSNPGMPPGPLASVASGGELSRCMLAFKAVLSEDGGADSMIFDEIDAGISGATSAAVGERLKALGGRAQVFVVTHQPQIAVMADCHFLIEKHTENGETRTRVRRLSRPERVAELSRLLSGAEVTKEAERAAEAMLAGAG
jgi:DNA repair protein RecN (Recombination protein N)